jgi:hypothetical protein
MIFNCPFCGATMGTAATDCAHCGRRAGRPCPHCAETVAADAKLCKYCGEDIEPARAPAPPPSPRPEVEFLEEPVLMRCAWEDASKGFLRRWWGTWRESNFHPQRFFRAMPPSGGHRWPVGFAFGYLAQLLSAAVVLGSGFAVGAALTGHPLRPSDLRTGAAVLVAAIPAGFLLVTAGLYLASILWHIPLKILGAKEGFQATLRIVGYSTGTQVWNLVPGLGVLQPFLQAVLLYHGLRQVHGMSRGRAWIALLLPMAVGAGIVLLVLAGLASGALPAGGVHLPK